MDDDRLVKVSRYLSKHLRHRPERLGLDLEAGGWVSIERLLEACNRQGMRLSRAELDEVVRRNDKQRYSIDATGTRIRANQGHSIDVDLQLEPAVPPAVLFHGTGAASVPSILRDGLDRRGRHHVHLSADVGTARRVGARHGRPAVLQVDAAGLSDAGALFFVSDNGVWLTKSVPARFVSLLMEN